MDRDDAWYGGSGPFDDASLGYAARRPPGGFRSSHLGEELDLEASRPLGGGSALALGVSRLWGGAAAREVLPAGEEGWWAFLQLIWRR